MKKINVRLLTEGAIISAMICLMFLIANLSPDSIFYFIIPIPLAIYSFRYGKMAGFMSLSSTLFVCFLFGNPYYIMIYLLPNLFLGLIIGLLERTNLKQVINYIIVFVLSLAIDILSTKLLKYLVGIDLFSDIELIKSYSDELYAIMKGFIPSIFVLSAIIKTIFVEFFLHIILHRLGLMEKKSISFYYGKEISFAAIMVLLLFFGSFVFNIYAQSMFSIILVNVFLIILLLIGIYLIMQANIYLSYKIKNRNYIFLSSIAVFILFPISFIFAIYLNFKYRLKVIEKPDK